MDTIYKIEHIEGKNLGCVALIEIKKGTLILQEKPQVIENGSKPSLIYLLNSYNQMNDATQKEFLKLYNRFKDLNEMNEEDKENVKQEMEWLQQNLNFDHKVLQRIQDIYGIYATNTFEQGVGIQASRFNHSCRSNAEEFWNEKYGATEIRSVSKINAGEEITINYRTSEISMKCYKTRQSFLFSNWGFQCKCDLCEEEKANCEDAKYIKFEELKKLQQKSSEKSRQIDSETETDEFEMIFQLERTKKEVDYYKEMYKIAKEKKASRIFILKTLLNQAFETAARGYLSAQNLDKIKESNDFKMDCANFARVGEQLSKVVYGCTYNGWAERKLDFEKWINTKLVNKLNNLKGAASVSNGLQHEPKTNGKIISSSTKNSDFKNSDQNSNQNSDQLNENEEQ